MNRLTPVLLGAVGLALAACYTLDRRDIFATPLRPPSPAALAALSDARHHLRTLELDGLGRPVTAYWDDGQDAKGFLIFFTGNGYGAESALRRILVPARALGLDLVVFDYDPVGGPVPTMAQMRRTIVALYDAAAALKTAQRSRIFLGGHSLGCTFALMLAGDRPADGTFVAAPVTTGVQMLHHQAPYSRLAWLRPDADYAQFNNLELAARVKGPVLVVGSSGDVDLPPAFTHRVYDALCCASRKQEVILSGVGHSAYLGQAPFWRAVSQFFALPLNGDPVGYLKAGA